MKTFIAFWLPALVLVAVVVVVGFLWLQEPKGPQPGHASPYVPMLKEAPKPLFSNSPAIVSGNYWEGEPGEPKGPGVYMAIGSDGKAVVRASGTDCKVKNVARRINGDNYVECKEFVIEFPVAKP